MGQLAAELLTDEVAAGFSSRSGVMSHGAFEAAEEIWIVVVRRVLFLGFCLGVVSVDAKASLFVDVGVAHGYYDRVDGDIHHDDVEY